MDYMVLGQRDVIEKAYHRWRKIRKWVEEILNASFKKAN